jgi:hypothetical protein
MFNFLQLKLSLLASIFCQSQSYLCFGLFGDKDLVPSREQIVSIFHRNQWPLREFIEMTMGAGFSRFCTRLESEKRKERCDELWTIADILPEQPIL